MPFQTGGGNIAKLAYDKSVQTEQVANEAKTTSDTVKSQFDQVVAEAGTNNPEVVQARGNAVNLNERLNQTDVLLAEKAPQQKVDEVQAQLDTLVLQAGNPEASSAEIMQSRVDSKGKVFPTLKDHFDNIEKIIIDGISVFPIKSFVWEQGNIYSSGADAPSTNTYYPMSIRTDGYHTLPNETLYGKVVSGYTVDVFKYNGTTFVSYTRYTTDFSFVPESGMSYRFCIGYSANITIEQGLSAFEITTEFSTANGLKIKKLETTSTELTNNNFEDSYNEFDISNLKTGYLYDTNSVANNSLYSYNDVYLPASEGFYQIDYAKVLFYDSAKAVIKAVNSFELFETVTSTPANTAFMRISVKNDFKHKSLVRKTDLCKFRKYKPFGLVPKENSPWKGKTGLFYGTSITAQSHPDLFNGYCGWVVDHLGFGNAYVRGVGGQTYFWNTKTFFANADGSYNSRGGAQPAGTTEHKGSFCSWDRIKAMIPTSIKDTIDIIYVEGGTNDLANAEESTGSGLIEYVTPVWSSANTLDADWVADTTYYNGGDYNLTTFSGAIASTIMKLKIWCPNAVIVVITPFVKWNTTTKEQFKNADGKTMRDVALAEIKTAEYMSCKWIDANADCQINAFNFTSFVTDGTHPANNNAKKMYARPIIAESRTIIPVI